MNDDLLPSPGTPALTEAIPGPAYRIQTERLLLLPMDPSHAVGLREAVTASADDLRAWMPWATQEPETIEQKIAQLRKFRGWFDAGTAYCYSIFDPAATAFLGGIGAHYRVGAGGIEIGYWIRSDQTGRGLMTEAAAALTRVCFEIERVDRVEIHCDVENERSIAVARRLGFGEEARLSRQLEWPDGRRRDAVYFVLFACDWPASSAFRAATTARAYDAIGRELMAGPAVF